VDSFETNLPDGYLTLLMIPNYYTYVLCLDSTYIQEKLKFSLNEKLLARFQAIGNEKQSISFKPDQRPENNNYFTFWSISSHINFLRSAVLVQTLQNYFRFSSVTGLNQNDRHHYSFSFLLSFSRK
jgi:hypothetical protein